jgi:predicted GNAT family N-acyltransferase
MENEAVNSQDCIISKDKSFLQLDRIVDMLSKSYWANNRTKDIIRKSVRHSMCFGVYLNKIQIGFARVITDFATTYYLCDVIIDEAYRGHGLGKRLMQVITEDEQIKLLSGILATRDAHGFYEKFGFTKNTENFMRKRHD